jgi:hypothetical protein
VTAGGRAGVGEALAAASASFGLPDALRTSQADCLAGDLEAAWCATYGALATLQKDLQRTRRYFDPVASGNRLRGALAALPATEFSVAVPTELAIPVAGERLLITPEGRCAIDLLRRDARVSGEAVFLPAAAVHGYEALLLRLYRDWDRHRLRQVVALLGGDDKPLQLPAAGVVLALLVNRSNSPEQAIRKRADRSTRQLVEEAFFAAVYRFADAFGASGRRDPRKQDLFKGWAVGEVRRRLDRVLVSDSDMLYLPEDRRADAVSRLANELARRRDADEDKIAAGFDGLVAALREHVAAFASYGMAHERPRDTARLREELLSSYRGARA